jgi:hypothetical protein
MDIKEPCVLLSLETHKLIALPEFGREFASMWLGFDGLEPQRISWGEDRYKNDFLGIDDLCRKWWGAKANVRHDGKFAYEWTLPLSWIRKKSIKHDAQFNFASAFQIERGDPSSFRVRLSWKPEFDFHKLFLNVIRLMEPDIAMMHLFVSAKRGLQIGDNELGFRSGSFGGRFRPGIPDMAWAMAFGDGKRSLDKLLRVGVDELPLERVGRTDVLTVTPQLSDIVDDYSRFVKNRDKLKGYFNRGVFREEVSE